MWPFSDVTGFLDIYDKPIPCKILNRYTCPCMFGDISKSTPRVNSRADTLALLNGYLRGMEKLVRSGRYDRSDDFTVVLQPFSIGTMFPYASPRPGARPQPDISFFAPDCFHPAQKTHTHRENSFLAKNLQVF
jgi:phospholipase B1